MKQMMIAALMLVSTMSTMAAADNKPAPKASAPKAAEQLVTDDCARARKAGKQCVVNMENTQVGGEGASGTGIAVGVIQTGKQPSLIRVRRDFIAEMIKTTEDL